MTINKDTILKISEVIKDLPLTKVLFGANNSYKNTEVRLKPNVYERLDMGKVTSIINTSFNIIVHKDKKLRKVKCVNHIYALAPDRSVIEYVINTEATAGMFTDDMDTNVADKCNTIMMRVCLLYAQGIVSDNEIKNGIGEPISIPTELDATSIIEKSRYEGFVTTAANIKDYIATGDELKQTDTDYYTFVEDSMDALLYETSDAMKLEPVVPKDKYNTKL